MKSRVKNFTFTVWLMCTIKNPQLQYVADTKRQYQTRNAGPEILTYQRLSVSLAWPNSPLSTKWREEGGEVTGQTGYCLTEIQNYHLRSRLPAGRQGCFWHGHSNCKYFVVPRTRTNWWLNKITVNKTNDEKAVKALRKDGWKVITIWECRLKPCKVERTFSSLLKQCSLSF